MTTRKGTGAWRASVPRFRFLLRGHDALYIAAWRWRLRVIKPGRGR